MFSLVRRYIKTAIGFLLCGLAIGGWMIARRELGGIVPGAYVVSAHTHALFVGFVMLMIMGVALWLFPRPDKTDTRYKPALAEAAYWLVTAGTAARVAGELLRASSAPAWRRSPASRSSSTRCGRASAPSAASRARRRASAFDAGHAPRQTPCVLVHHVRILLRYADLNDADRTLLGVREAVGHERVETLAARVAVEHRLEHRAAARRNAVGLHILERVRGIAVGVNTVEDRAD